MIQFASRIQYGDWKSGRNSATSIKILFLANNIQPILARVLESNVWIIYLACIGEKSSEQTHILRTRATCGASMAVEVGHIADSRVHEFLLGRESAGTVFHQFFAVHEEGER